MVSKTLDQQLEEACKSTGEALARRQRELGTTDALVKSNIASMRESKGQ
jgi:hypothetical protein